MTLKRVLCVTSLAVTLAVPAGAQGVRLGGSVTQSFDLTNSGSGSGTSFGADTSFRLNLSSRTPVTRISASTGISLSYDSQSNDISFSQPRLNLNFGHDTKTVKYSGGLTYSKRPATVDVTQPNLTVLRFSGDESRIDANLGGTAQINARTSFSLSGTYSSVEYDPVSAGLFPTRNLGLNASLNQQISPVTSYGVSASIGLFEADNASDTTSVSANLSGQATYQIDSITDVSGNLGVSFIETTDTVLGVESSSFSVALTFGANVNRQLPDGSISLGLNQNVAPSSGGSLVLDTQLTGNWSKTVNNDVSIGLGANIGRQEDVGGGTVTTFFGISPTYSRRLTRDITANASLYLQRDNNGNSASGIAVSFGRSFDFPLN